MAFKCLSFKGCPWIAHWTSQDRWKVHTSVVPKRWSFSGFPFWPGPVTPQTSHTSVQSRWWLWDPEDIFFITTMEAPGKLALAAHCHSDYDPQSPCLHTDHLELLASATHYHISNVNWPNIHSCQWQAVPFQSVHWFGTQASPRFQPNTLPQHSSTAAAVGVAAGAPAETALNGTAKSRLPPAFPWR